MRRTRTWVGEDGSVHHHDIQPGHGLTRENPLLAEDKESGDFNPINIWFDVAIASTVVVDQAKIAETIAAARTDEATWRRYMHFAFGEQAMPRDMAKYVDSRDKYLAAYMKAEAEKDISNTGSEQQLRANRFEHYCRLLRFSLPVERREEFNDSMQIAGAEMRIFGDGIERHVGGTALSVDVVTAGEPPLIVGEDSFVMPKTPYSD